MNDSTRKILSRLESQCAKRECCSTDVMRKCADAGLQEKESAEIMTSLVSGGYVDDLRYCRAFAAEKSKFTGWGAIKIRMALAAKKLDRQLIDTALSELDTGNVSKKLMKLLKARNKALKGDPQRRLKLIRYALSRGYEYSQVSELLPELDIDDASGQDDFPL